MQRTIVQIGKWFEQDRAMRWILTAVFIGILGVAFHANATEYFIATNGNDKNVGSKARPWASLKHGMMQLKAGDILTIRGGTYRKTANIILVKKHGGTASAPVTVRGYAGEKVVFKDFGGITLRKGGGYWVFQDLNFTGTHKNWYGIAIGRDKDGRNKAVHHITIRNISAINSNKSFIGIDNAHHILIENSYFEDLRSHTAGEDRHAIVMGRWGHDIVIRNNEFKDIGADGVHVGWKWKRFSDTAFTGIQILNNKFWVQRPYVGPYGNVGENAIDIKKADNVVIRGNIIQGFRPHAPGQDASGSQGTGITLHNACGSGYVIEGNLFHDNAKHLHTGSCKNIDIVNNVFDKVARTTAYVSPVWDEPYGLYVGKGGRDVQVKHNSFRDNIYHLYLVTKGKKNAKNVTVVNNLFVNDALTKKNSYYQNWKFSHNAFVNLHGAVPDFIKNPQDIVAGGTAVNVDFTLPSGSPVIDQGKDIGVANDFSGNSRNLPPDIGAYEFGSVASLPKQVPVESSPEKVYLVEPSVIPPPSGIETPEPGLPKGTLVKNGHFTGAVEPWALYPGGDGGAASIRLMLSNSDTGSRDVATVVMNSRNVPVYLGQSAISLKAGVRYRLTLALKGLHVDAVSLHMLEGRQDGKSVGLAGHGLPVTGTWQRHEVIFTATKATANAWFGIGINSDAPASQLFIDKVELKKLGEQGAHQPVSTVEVMQQTLVTEAGVRMPAVEAEEGGQPVPEAGQHFRPELLHQRRQLWEQCKASCYLLSGTSKVNCIRECLAK